MPALELSHLSRNRLLGALPSKDRKRLLPRIELVSFQQSQILHKPGELYHYVYFPIDAVVSFVSTMQNGTGVEVGLIGNEGMVGMAITMGTERDQQGPTAIVQVPGDALRLKRETFLHEFKHCGALHDQVLLFFGFALRQVTQTAACNRVHLLINRLCRWLLMVQDRTGRDSFPFTHEFLGEMLGAPPFRKMGMGVVVEYAGQQGEPKWVEPPETLWDYRPFASAQPTVREPDEIIPLQFESKFHGQGAFDSWTINGKSYPDTDTIMLRQGRRYRLRLINRSMDDHPLHLHRHTFEVTSLNGKPLSGLNKDVLVVPANTAAEVDFTANNPGATLFHCHNQTHMDFGFMMLFRYA